MQTQKFTKQQQNAIFLKNKSILVAAAAGSGKTSILVERVLNIISDIDLKVDIDNLLIVTFTESAALEMKQRIEQKIIQKLHEDNSNKHLEKQLALINKANISTIHSFCSKIIRQNFNILDIDPNFKIADISQILLLKKEILNDLIEEELEKNKNFEMLFEYFNTSILSENLYDLILKIYDFSQNNLWPQKWLEQSLDFYKNISPNNNFWSKIIQNEIQMTLKEVEYSLFYAIKICKQEKGPFKFLENLYDDQIILENLSKYCQQSLPKLYSYLDDIKFSKLKLIKNDPNVCLEMKDIVKNLRDKDIKGKILAIKNKILFKSLDSLYEDMYALYPIMSNLIHIVIDFSKHFALKKLENNILDFNDLEHLCLKILFDEPNNCPTTIATQLSQNYFEIMIDEYQDSNYTQEFILKSISKKNDCNRFMVGDVKQSIYGFRNSNPEIFIEKYNNYCQDLNSDFVKIDLSNNFRSRNCVIDFINFLFFQIMSKDVGNISYNQNHMLKEGAIFEQTNLNISSNVDLDFIDYSKNFSSDDDSEDLNQIELECKLISKKILNILYENPLFIYDKNKNYRKVEFGDICILLRSVTNVGQILIQELKKVSIPASINTSKNYYDSLEILTIISLLNIIDNPRQDLYIISVLHSPIYSLTNNDLVSIRVIDQNCDFYNCIKKYIELYPFEKLSKILTKFLIDLQNWRNLSTYLTIFELISKLYLDTNYINFVSLMPGGSIRVRNLHIFRDLAQDFEKNGYKNLFSFINYIDKLKSTNIKINDCSNKDDNFVKIMTIHKSKGLEFPVVIVSFLGKSFNFIDEKQPVLLERDLGLGSIHINLENRIKSNTISRYAVSKKIHTQSICEEVRILYVALTRAKEKLILTGSFKNFEKKILDLEKFIEFPDIEFPAFLHFRCNNFLDFILPCILRHKNFEKFLKKDFFINSYIYNFNTSFNVTFWDILDLKNDQIQKENLEQYSNFKSLFLNNTKKFEFDYEYNFIKNLPSAISVSEISKYFEKPNFENANSIKNTSIKNTSIKNTSILKGNAYHKVLRHLNFNIHTDFQKIKSFLDVLLSQNIISNEEFLLLDINKILPFINSEIVQKIKISKTLKREIAFIIALTPYEIFKNTDFIGVKDLILVSGIIDCYFIHDDKIILIDYKTNSFTNQNFFENKYKIQMDIYKKALEKSTNMFVKHCYIYSIQNENFFEIF